MTAAEARDFGWIVVQPLVGFVLVVALFLLGLALLGQIRR